MGTDLKLSVYMFPPGVAVLRTAALTPQVDEASEHPNERYAP